MKRLPKGLRPYALFLLLLLVLAASASYTTVTYLGYHPQLQHAQEALNIINLMLFALSLGFLFLAGALGLWGIRYAAEAESRRRVGILVDSMSYVTDGVVAIDRRARVIGSNPAARLLSAADTPDESMLPDLFPCVSERDVAVLMDKSRPQEVERTLRTEEGVRTLRFRSEPAEHFNQVLISDVTERKAHELRERQSAHLQLIGRIARGVSHDFNTILCAISGHAALLRSMCPDSENGVASLEAIEREAERGAALARHLVDLSRSGSGAEPTHRFAEHCRKAAELIQADLPSPCRVVTDIEGTFVAVPFAGRQVEQLVINLGHLAASRLADGCGIHLLAREPGATVPWNLSSSYAAILVVAAARNGRTPELGALQPAKDTLVEHGGVILSVLRGLVEEVGGRLDAFTGPDHRPAFRLCLPRHDRLQNRQADLAGLPEDLTSCMAEWSVLLGCPGSAQREELEWRMSALGITVELADDLVTVLAQVEDRQRSFAGILLEKDMIVDETEGTLRAILKLQPAAGLVLLDESPEWIPRALRDEVVYAASTSGPENILKALIRGREIAENRTIRSALARTN